MTRPAKPATTTTRTRGRRSKRLLGLASLTSLAVTSAGIGLASGGGAAAAPVTTAATSAAAGVQRGDVQANLFEWNWPSVARECTTVLGPKGYGGVQVAPPQDSLKRTALGNGSDTVLHPWWEVYQPVDYRLTSRMGSEAQFRSMVKTCRAAGVKVYVDAVINHMTGQGDTSYGGVHYSKYDYPGLYTTTDFHHAPGDCPTSDGTIQDFNDYRQVTKCELVGLADLATEQAKVRTTIAGYLNKLIRYGVSGFRVDAAKHVGHADLAAIESLLHVTKDGTRPYVALEVYNGPGKLSTQSYTRQGDVLGFDAATQIHDAFKSYTSAGTGGIAVLQTFGAGSGLIASDKSLAFVTNHDQERGTATLNYKDGATYTIANEFLLARGYGTPQVYDGFQFGTDTAQSPPSTADGMVTDVPADCSGWVCTHRDHGVEAMVGFHNLVTGTPVQNWHSNGANLIGFSRGSKGWVSINNGTGALTKTFPTGLAAGTYCDIVHGDLTGGSCSGATVRVGADGTATVRVPAKDAVSVDVVSRVGG